MSTKNELSDWTVKQLQEELRKRKLPVSGLKAVLVRLNVSYNHINYWIFLLLLDYFSN